MKEREREISSHLFILCVPIGVILDDVMCMGLLCAAWCCWRCAVETLARVTDRSRDRVDSVMFFVRDKLRLEVSKGGRG